MSVLIDEPTVGKIIVLGLDNPLGTQAPGSFPFVALSSAPDPAFPCGTVLPGFGMGGLGELLIDVFPPNPVEIYFDSLWAGPGFAAPVLIPIPDNPALAGMVFYAQGILVDTSPGAPVPFGLTDAVEIGLGP